MQPWSIAKQTHIYKKTKDKTIQKASAPHKNQNIYRNWFKLCLNLLWLFINALKSICKSWGQEPGHVNLASCLLLFLSVTDSQVWGLNVSSEFLSRLFKWSVLDWLKLSLGTCWGFTVSLYICCTPNKSCSHNLYCLFLFA